MQQQVMKRNMSSEFAWGSGADGGLGQQSSTSGSGSWTSTANPESTSSPATSWQVMGKSDSASDAGDDASSVKSGSTVVTNITPQSQDSTITTSTGTLQTSSSPWSTSNCTVPSMDSSPWGNTSSSAVSSIGSMGWASNPAGLSLSSSSQGHNIQPGSNIVGNNSAFNSSSSSSSSVWPSSLTGSTSNLPPNMGSGLQVNALSSQWPSSSMIGNIGDLSKSSDSAWNHPASSLIDNKDLGGTSSEPRMWGISTEKPSDSQWDTSKSQWGNSALAASGDHATSATELSFAQATLKGLKIAPSANTPQTPISSRHEEMMRAIESHDGWGSRPIRQDTSWDVDASPKTQRKLSSDGNAAASNVWDNSNGTAIWEAVRENQTSNWSGAASAGGSSWNVEKDSSSWGLPPKPSQEPSSWNVGGSADPKTFATWGTTGAAGDASNKMWAQKTEVGSWGESVVQRTTGISSWGDDGDGGAWEEQRRLAASVGGMQVLVPPSPSLGGPAGMPGIVPHVPGMNTAVMNTEPGTWNDAQKAGWNSANSAVKNHTNLDEPWNKPPPTRTGWGDPAQDGAEVDNGTSIWVATTPKQLPPQVKVAGWGDAAQQNQWNAAVGAKTKMPGWDDAAWAMAQRTKPLPSQQVPQKYMNSGSNPPTQMRSKLLQQLMDMGYRKEEAQNALITNNLNMELAINDLKSGNVNISRKDLDMDMFQANVSQSRMPYINKGGLGGEDMSDMRPDQVPTYNLQNTQFPNAQTPNQAFMQNIASLPASSLNTSSSSINSSLQQKLMQKMQQQQAPPSFGHRGPLPPVGPGTNNQVPQQQQQQQQQLRSQLRQAVNSGLISQQLINYQLPHNILVLLHQLLQLQAAHQTVAAKHQQMIQQARATGSRNNPQLEQMSGIISNINQQMISVQKQLQQAQSTFFSSQKPPSLNLTAGTITPQSNQQTGVNMIDILDALSTDLANVALQSQSRLTTQWKPSIDASAAAAADTATTTSASVTAASKVDDGASNKAPGTKGLLQTSSSPNLNLIPGGLGMTGDKTWSSNVSSTISSNWPMPSSENVASNSQAEVKVGNSSSSSTSLLAGLPSGLTDVIPEFVPGKPWQGLAKNVEDDPHVTPGSIQLQRSLSVNRVHDDSLHNLDGHKMSTTSWATGLKADSLGLSQLGSRPPPSMSTMGKGIGQQWQPGVNYNRQTCWPHSANSAFTKVTGSGWNDNNGISSWLLLKNLTVDPNTVRALCAQHGSLASFYTIAQGQLALVQYSSREIAFGAQQRLNNFQMGTSIMTAEFIGETDAQRFTAQMPPPQASALPPMNTSPWSQAPPSTPFQNAGVRAGDPWSNSMLSQPSSKFASAGENLWGLWDRSDHNFNPLSNILGGESM